VPESTTQTLMLSSLARVGTVRRDAVPGGADIVRPVALGPSLWASLVPTVTTSDSAAGYPLAESRNGSMFEDGGDPNVTWYLPAYALRQPDPAFAFGAIRDGADSEGRPFNRASISLGLVPGIPSDVQTAQASNPGRDYRQIPILSLGASLILHSKAQDGADRRSAFPGHVEADGAGSTLLFAGLLGSDVVIAFADLTATGRAELEVQYSYDTARWIDVPAIPGPIPIPPIVVKVPPPSRQPVPVDIPTGTAQMLTRAAEVGRVASLLPRNGIPTAEPGGIGKAIPIDGPTGPGHGPLRPPTTAPPPATIPPPPARRRLAVHASATETATMPVADTYANPSYRPKYTLTDAGATHGIVSAQDLQEFQVDQSEYIELTALGNVAGRYPTLRALYLGQVSGTVVAVPAAYGILRTHAGCGAACDVVVDPSPTSAGGCRFHLSFALGPIVDPGDLARLASDLASEPTLSGRELHLTLPTDLDRRTPSTLQSSSVTSLTYGVGLSPNTFLLSLDIADDDLPAVVKANLFLEQLMAPTTPTLVGRLAVRLDDAHTPVVTADMVLNLHSTAGSDEVTIAVDETGVASVTNASPLDLEIVTSTAHTKNGFTTAAVHQTLAAGTAVPLTLPPDLDQVLVDCSLALPDPLPEGAIADYVTISTENVQRIHHAIGFNATGQLAPAISKVSIAMTLDDAPDVALPTIELTPEHPIDNTAVEVPVAFAITGLATTLALTVTHTDGSPQFTGSLTHDFLAHPILTLTREQLTTST